MYIATGLVHRLTAEDKNFLNCMHESKIKIALGQRSFSDVKLCDITTFICNIKYKGQSEVVDI